MVRCLLATLLLLAVSGTTRAEGLDAGHASLALAYDTYNSNAFAGGRDDSSDAADLNPGLAIRYVREPTGRLAWLPTLGIGISRWQSRLEGNCCGFGGADVDTTYTALDLLVARILPSPDTREVLYVLVGTTSADVETDFDTAGVKGVSTGHQRAHQFGIGFFSGAAGGYTGGLELRHTRLSDYGVTTVQFMMGIGF